MTADRAPATERFFRGLVRARWIVLAVYALLLPAAIVLALRVPEDSAIERLIVPDDPDAVQTRAFQAVFPDTPRVVLVVQSQRLYEPPGLDAVRRLETRLNGLPHVTAVSALSLFDRAASPGDDPAARARAFAAFARGSRLLHRQGMAGEDWLGLPVSLQIAGSAERDEALAAIDAAIAEGVPGEPSLVVRRVGGPYIESWIERATAASSQRTFPLFGLFVVVLTLVLYRSVRALGALLVSLGVCVALAVGFGSLLGYSFTILSSLVPLTVLVTATATLVYVHSRFVDCPEGVDPFDHQPVALANKLTPCLASLFAAAVGFAALAVSNIRPVREMGLWTASGLGLTALVVFTLFPSLQRILRTPTRQQRRLAARWFGPFVERLPGFSWRWRWTLLILSLGLNVAGLAALFGVPGWLQPMRLETDSLAYVPADLPIARDTRWFEQQIGGLGVMDAWIEAPAGTLLEPDVLRGLDRFARRVEADPDVTSVAGPTTLLAWMRALGGQDERLPDDPAEWEKLAGDFEQLLLKQPELREFVDTRSLAQARMTIIHRSVGWEGVDRLSAGLRRAWEETAREVPALAPLSLRVVGQGLLQAKIARNLVPTLTQSFALTAGIIFVTFLAVFRSGAARLLAMIPSVFSLLVTFLLMRATAIPLNVATILIASVVLGASENDQIHFFYHFQEKGRKGGRKGSDAFSTEAALRHTLSVAGRAIFFATLINAGGFLALALSDLPPMRQFGIVSSSAFLFSMLADFSVLPASLWLVFRDRPRRAEALRDEAAAQE